MTDPEVCFDDHMWITILCEHCGHKIEVPVYCGNRFCKVCGRPRLSRVRRRLNWMVARIHQRNDYSIKHLTLTITNEPDLPKMLKHIVSAFRRLRQRAFWKRHVLGGAYVIEITGRPGNWHAHLHIIIHSYYLPYAKLLALWKKCSGSQGVYIKQIPQKDVIRYLTKYLSKPDVPEQVLTETAEALKGYRLFHPFGEWYKILKGYVDQKPGCPKCGEQCWLPLDIFYGRRIHPHSRESPATAVA